MTWYAIRTAKGELLSSENGFPYIFPSRREAGQWCSKGDTIEVWTGGFKRAVRPMD